MNLKTNVTITRTAEGISRKPVKISGQFRIPNKCPSAKIKGCGMTMRSKHKNNIL